MSQSVAHLFFEKAQSHAKQPGILVKRQGTWLSLSFEDIANQIERMGRLLLSFGIQPGDRIGILSQTRLEWLLCDLAILSIGGITVPIYPSTIASEVAYLLNDAQVRFLFVENQEQANKVQSVLTKSPTVQQMVCFTSFTDSACLSFDQWFNAPVTITKEAWQQHMDATNKNSIATIVYTSGTTGVPKGVVLRHSNLLYEAEDIEEIKLLSSEDVQLLFLPLSHIFAKVMAIAWIQTTHLLAFAESIEKAVDNMGEVQPTLVAAVPRVFEKIRSKIVETALQKGKITSFLFSVVLHWIKQQADARAHERPYHNPLLWLAKRGLLYPIGRQLKKRLGGRIRFLISGGAPLSLEVAYFFENLGLPILQGYGLTETSGASCVNLPRSYRIGTVGKPFPKTEIRIEQDGEICMKGPGVFSEYWNLPKETKEAFDGQGWFHTGDIGKLTSDGFLQITDRKKDMIVTASGKKLSPQKIENMVKNSLDLISHVFVYGDQKPYAVALIALDSLSTVEFAQKNQLPKDLPLLSQTKAVQDLVTNAIQRANQRLSRFEQIKKWSLLDHDFQIGNQITTTLKLRREHCKTLYKTELENLYLP